MKIILKSKIKHLGNIGDIIDVKDGYARNMLIPNNLAVFYTEKNYEVFKLEKEKIEKENEEARVKAEELKSKIVSKDLILIENASDDGKLYGSITNIKIAKFINSLLKLNLKKTNISFKDSIREIGKYTILITLHSDVSFDKDIIIARNKEEAIKIKKGEFKIEKESKFVVDEEALKKELEMQKQQAKLEEESQSQSEEDTAKKEEKKSDEKLETKKKKSTKKRD